MIYMFNKLMDLIFNLLDKLFIFELPSLPDSVIEVYDTALGYISTGFSVLAAFVGADAMKYMAVICGLVIAINALYSVYSFVMWVLRKIPFLGID